MTAMTATTILTVIACGILILALRLGQRAARARERHALRHITRQ